MLIAIVRSCATVTAGFIFSGSTGVNSNWRNAFDSEPGWGVDSINYKWEDLAALGCPPC